MRVIPLTSLLSHKGRGGLTPNRNDTLSLDVKVLFKHALRRNWDPGLIRLSGETKGVNLSRNSAGPGLSPPFGMSNLLHRTPGGGAVMNTLGRVTQWQQGSRIHVVGDPQ